MPVVSTVTPLSGLPAGAVSFRNPTYGKYRKKENPGHCRLLTGSGFL
ncbi:hypothetical protein Mpet_2278 [Methanolacinia petrolearia DSM 11571]|uniref:Uncharacterized protein n=1 Tax=Methanolacinia petrolearia (strain DSM 11571 / OCM 486 / SEBR 4847) TaxID=679926 RepID=E1RD43_METP4|nr:hypothetical protein Mpet_2278 [Methanolacinia petrolearia DSM 11571]